MRRLPAPLALMWEKFGPGPGGRKCKDCVRCGFVQYPGRRFYKCSFYGNGASEATDWRANWPACGIFEEGSMKLAVQLKPVIDATAQTFVFPDFPITWVQPIIRTGAKTVLHELRKALAGRKSISTAELERWIAEQTEQLSPP